MLLFLLVRLYWFRDWEKIKSLNNDDKKYPRLMFMKIEKFQITINKPFRPSSYLCCPPPSYLGLNQQGQCRAKQSLNWVKALYWELSLGRGGNYPLEDELGWAWQLELSLHHLDQALKRVVCHRCGTSASIWTKQNLEEKSSTFSAIQTFFRSNFFPDPAQSKARGQPRLVCNNTISIW